jgi:hypothetical protein
MNNDKTPGQNGAGVGAKRFVPSYLAVAVIAPNLAL